MQGIGVSNRELAERAGVHVNTISKYRSKAATPQRIKPGVLDALVEALNAAAKERNLEVRFTADHLTGLKPHAIEPSTADTQPVAIPALPVAQVPVVAPEVPHRCPQWLSLQDWAAYLDTWRGPDQFIRCQITRQRWIAEGRAFEEHDLPLATSIDHILAKHHGGTDALENLQPATAEENWLKSTQADAVWGYEKPEQDFYDLTPDLQGFRVSQRAAGYDAALSVPDLWLAPRNLYSGNLLLLPMVVRGGKLLASMLAVPFAINSIIRAKHPLGAPRVKSVLLLTREESLRDQFVAELKTQPVRYGIVSSTPRVKCIEKSEWLVTNNQRIRGHWDICVACIQMFFPGGGDSTVPMKDLSRLLANYDLICFDEPHWAFGQVRALVKQASWSWTIGTTGTPLVVGKETPEPLVGDAEMGIYRLSTWSADDADDLDGSLKYIPPVEEIVKDETLPKDEPGNTEVQCRLIHIINDISDRESEVLPINHDAYVTGRLNGCEQNLHYKQRVCGAVLADLYRRDSYWSGEAVSQELAPHRREQEWEPTLVYPPHALIATDGIASTESLADFINTKLDQLRIQHPGKYRLEDGWRAEAVHGPSTFGRDGTTSDPYKAKPLTIPPDPKSSPDSVHPWLRSYLVHEGAKIDSKCARILVVDQMVREGIGNPLCISVAWACSIDRSIHEVAQRGSRAFGAFTKPPAEHGAKRQCPPKELDSPILISHSCWTNNFARMIYGAAYIRSSETYLNAIPFAVDLLEGHTLPQAVIEPLSPEKALLREEKLAIVRAIGDGAIAEQTDGAPAAPVDLATLIHPTRWEAVADAAKAWAEKVQQEPYQAQTALGLESAPSAFPIATPIVNERGRTTIDPERLREFIRTHRPELWNLASSLGLPDSLEPGGPVWEAAAADWSRFQQQHCGGVGAKLTDLVTLQRSYTREALIEACGLDHKSRLSEGDKGKAHAMCMNVFKDAVNANRKELFKVDGPWDVPAVHHLLISHRQLLIKVLVARLVKARFPGTESLRAGLAIN
jgi:transcriptional regulator with XRE-family HTH domain